MKSKTSFFNKGIFWKNVTLYWPIWGLYTVVLLIFVPGLLWLASNSWDYPEQLKEEQVLDIVGGLPQELYTVIIACMALCTGMALFSYLFHAKTANMIHSLPVDRNQLFGTNVISGLAFLIVPQMFTFVVSVLYCLSRGISHLEYLVAWLVMSMITAFVAYSIVTFCSFLTGQLVTMVGFVFLMNIISFVILTLIDYIYTVFAFGMNGRIISEEIAVWCSPLAAFMCLSANPTYEYEVYVGMDIVGKDVMLVYSIIAIILYVISWSLYKKRHIEHAGDLITVPFLKPVFRWSVGFYATLGFTPVCYAIFREINKNIPLPLLLIVFIIIGMIGYFIADMLLKKTFKVFKKKYFLEWGVYSVFLGVSCIGIYLSTVAYENAIPNKEEVAYAEINYGYNCRFEKDELDKVFAIHETIIENKDLFESMRYDYHYSDVFDYVLIYYYTKDGDIVTSRDYRIPCNEEGLAIFKAVSEYEKEPDKLLAHLFGNNYQNITTFGAGNVEYLSEYTPDAEGLVYECVEFDSNAAKVLYEAVIADAYAGTLYKHNAYWRYESVQQELLEIEKTSIETQTVPLHEDYTKDSQLWISYKWPEREHAQINQNPNSFSGLTIDYDTSYYDIDWEESEQWRDVSIDFDSECTNIVNALLELGLITSAEQIP